MKTHLGFPKLTLTAMSVLAIQSAALAQDFTGLEEIVVTAQKTAETLQDAALPINAATGEQLANAGVTSASALNKISPALTVSTGGGATATYFVRGVGNFVNNGYTAPAIAFNIDGAYVGRPSSTNAAFLDVNRVEVLKGPQGTLYGRNSTGGAINVIPNTPDIDEKFSSVTVGVGSHSSYELTGVTNIPTSDTSAVRLAATVVGHDGYLSDGTSDLDDTAIRVQYLTEVNEDLTVRVSADYSEQGGTGPGVQVDGIFQFAPFTPGPVPSWPFLDAPEGEFVGLHDPQILNYITENATAPPLFSPVTGFAYPQRDDKYFGLNGEITYQMENAELVIIPAYRKSKLDNVFNGPPFKAGINDDTAEQTSLEARISGSIGQVDYILGAYYFDESVEGQNSFNQFGTTSYNVFDSETDSKAIFARGTLNISDETRLVAGVRYSDESRSLDARAVSTAGVCLIEPPFGAPSCPQVPTLPVALNIDEALSSFNPSLLTGPPLPVLLDQISAAGDGQTTVTPFGPFGMMGPQAIIAATPTVLDLDDGEDETTFRLAFEHDVTPDNLIYASFESGFRAGGFNTTFGRETYAPEFIDAFTIGSKNRFMDNRLELNLEVFSWEYEDQQLAALGIDGRGLNSFYSQNVGSSSIEGVEIDFKFAATESTLLKGTIQYLDNTYDDFTYTQVDLSDDTDPPGFLNPVTGCNYQQLGVDGNPATPREFLIDCSGQQGLNAPDLSINLGVEHSFIVSDYEVTGYLDLRYRDERELSFNYVPGGRAESVTTVDAAISVMPAGSDDWNLSAYVRNIGDEQIFSTYQVGAGSVVSGAVEPPRTYGVRFTKNF